MKLELFGYEIIVRKLNTYQTEHQDLIERVKKNATKGLVQAELDLKLHTLISNTELDEDERQGIENALKSDERSIKNFKAQLEIVNHN